MELKNYQKRVLRELDAYISLLNSTQSLNAAYNKHWQQLGIAVGFSGLPPYNDVLPGVPHVCFKVPTGGGKTLLACASLRHIFSGMGMMKTKAVVWFRPMPFWNRRCVIYATLNIPLVSRSISISLAAWKYTMAHRH